MSSARLSVGIRSIAGGDDDASVSSQPESNPAVDINLAIDGLGESPGDACTDNNTTVNTGPTRNRGKNQSLSTNRGGRRVKVTLNPGNPSAKRSDTAYKLVTPRNSNNASIVDKTGAGKKKGASSDRSFNLTRKITTLENKIQKMKDDIAAKDKNIKQLLSEQKKSARTFDSIKIDALKAKDREIKQLLSE